MPARKRCLELYRPHRVPRHWNVDPDARTVAVWRFDEGEDRCERSTDRLPVRLGGETVEEIDAGEVFGWDGSDGPQPRTPAPRGNVATAPACTPIRPSPG